MDIKVSIIIPVYNSEKFLKRCLDSCINQTLDEIEVIAVNDASPDRSDIIMREYEEKYRVYDTLLFQMDSDYGDEDYVLWGDCGVGNFFIHQEDLKKRDFRKVLYNWDCC